MPISRGGRPSAYLIVLIAAVTLVPLAILSWLGWRLLEQDRLLQHEQIQQRIERGADLAIGSLQRAIAETERQVATGRESWPPGAVILRLEQEGFRAQPMRRLAFVPAPIPLPEAPASTFAAAETLEFQQGRADAAIEVYRTLTRHPDPLVRTGALLRLARAAQNAGRDADALEVYARLLDVNDAGLNGVPAALISMFGRCRLLEKAGRTQELQTESATLASALAESRWPLTAPVYWLYSADARRWSEGVSTSALASERLAAAAAALYEQWGAESPRSATSSRSLLRTDGGTLVVLRQAVEGMPAALLVDTSFVEHEWLPAAAPTLQATHIDISLSDPSGEPTAQAPSPSDLAAQVFRSAGESGLPWTIRAATTLPPPEARDFALRRRLLAAGMALLVLMVSAASYVIMRAISREMAVARLQSDFVAAVSHEFRTPLTSLRQFTEMLRDNPGLDEERRRLAYDAQSRSTDRLIRLVESLLDFGRMEAGEHVGGLSAHDCATLVGAVVDEVRDESAATGQLIEFHASGPAMALIDPDALARAVRNLLDNALKYSPDRGNVAVAVTTRAGEVAISVSDHGIGVPAHERSTIFAKFHRGAQARLRGIKGTGIGLAMVSEIVRAHRGRVDMDSTVNVGSTFTIVLPTAEADGSDTLAVDTALTWPES